MAVLFVFDTGLGVGSLLLALGAILIAELVQQVFGELTAADVDQEFPAAVTAEHLIDKFAPGGLRRLFLEQFDFRPQDAPPGALRGTEGPEGAGKAHPPQR